MTKNGMYLGGELLHRLHEVRYTLHIVSSSSLPHGRHLYLLEHVVHKRIPLYDLEVIVIVSI